MVADRGAVRQDGGPASDRGRDWAGRPRAEHAHARRRWEEQGAEGWSQEPEGELGQASTTHRAERFTFLFVSHHPTVHPSCPALPYPNLWSTAPQWRDDMSVSAADEHDFLEQRQSSRVPKVTATIRRTGGAAIAASLPGHLAPVGKGMFSSGGPEIQQRYKQKLPSSLFMVQSQIQGGQRGQRRRTAGSVGGSRRGGRPNGSNGPEVPDADAVSTITMAVSASMVGPPRRHLGFRRPAGLDAAGVQPPSASATASLGAAAKTAKHRAEQTESVAS